MSLKIEKLSKRYSQTWALKDVSFEANEGEILGIFGITGAGKSTLIRIISGTEQSNVGTIHHNSNEITSLSPVERKFHFPKLTNESFWKKIFKTEKKDWWLELSKEQQDEIDEGCAQIDRGEYYTWEEVKKQMAERKLVKVDA